MIFDRPSCSTSCTKNNQRERIVGSTASQAGNANSRSMYVTRQLIFLDKICTLRAN